MGSKRFMLSNGLGKLINREIQKANRFVDPFSGSAAVVWHVAEKFHKPVLASDLQTYSAALARAVIGRSIVLDTNDLENKWLAPGIQAFQKSKLYKEAYELQQRPGYQIRKTVLASRVLCGSRKSVGPLWRAYGGHYFSPYQALAFDYLITTLPKEEPSRSVALASLISAASKCAAAPGHTAQPFQPTKTAKKFIYASWRIDPIQVTRLAMKGFAERHANIQGEVRVADAIDIVDEIRQGDLVLIDPPYSGVQYSRFYHVLETIARGKCGTVSGKGRYPSLSERPQSKYSNAGESLQELKALMSKLAQKRATVIFTFPKGQCSNGLSGDKIIAIVEEFFDIAPESRIHEHVVVGKFSTLGGNNKTLLKNKETKKSRVVSQELILLLRPKQVLSGSKGGQKDNEKKDIPTSVSLLSV